MKKLFLSVCTLIAISAANAQTSFGAQVGGTYSSITSASAGVESNTQGKAGFLLGAVMEADFGSNISFRPELNFIRKGGQTEDNLNVFGITTKNESELSLSFIQLAPNFVYNITSKGGKFFLGLGPEFAFGIGGKAENNTSVSGSFAGIPIPSQNFNTKADVKFDGEENPAPADTRVHLKSFDYGVSGIAGYKWKNGFFASLGYTHGLSNLTPGGDSDNFFKTRGATLKVGYFFK